VFSCQTLTGIPNGNILRIICDKLVKLSELIFFKMTKDEAKDVELLSSKRYRDASVL